MKCASPMTASSRKKLQTIPDYLIYEMDEGKPIYYRGYKEDLEIMDGIVVNIPQLMEEFYQAEE